MSETMDQTMERKLRVLIAFNNYADIPTGGERNVALAEMALLKAHGHKVELWERSNGEISAMGTLQKLATLKNIGWSRELETDCGRVLDQFKPDVFHLHNFWLRMTPSVFAAAKERGITTVHTLHNFRMICPGTQLMWNGGICEDCLRDHRYARCLWRHCFLGGSRAKTILSYRLFREIRRRDFLRNEVDKFIVLSEFARKKFIEGGIPAKQVFVKPNFLEDPLGTNEKMPLEEEAKSKTVVFAGRLSREKGVAELVEAWKESLVAHQQGMELRIIGTGALEEELRQQAAGDKSIVFLGIMPREKVLEELKRARFLAFPSIWYEGMPLTLVEAQALGRPAVASDLGGRSEIVQHETHGFLYNPTQKTALREALERMILLPNTKWREMSSACRHHYKDHYTPERNYHQLLEIYRREAHS